MFVRACSRATVQPLGRRIWARACLMSSNRNQRISFTRLFACDRMADGDGRWAMGADRNARGWCVEWRRFRHSLSDWYAFVIYNAVICERGEGDDKWRKRWFRMDIHVFAAHSRKTNTLTIYNELKYMRRSNPYQIQLERGCSNVPKSTRVAVYNFSRHRFMDLWFMMLAIGNTAELTHSQSGYFQHFFNYASTRDYVHFTKFSRCNYGIYQ